MTDRVIDSIAGHLAASKSADYRDRVRLRFKTIISFLQVKGLTTRILLEEHEAPPDTLKIMQSDLTEKGFLLMKASYYKWLTGIDRGKSIEDTSILEKALKKLEAER